MFLEHHISILEWLEWWNDDSIRDFFQKLLCIVLYAMVYTWHLTAKALLCFYVIFNTKKSIIKASKCGQYCHYSESNVFYICEPWMNECCIMIILFSHFNNELINTIRKHFFLLFYDQLPFMQFTVSYCFGNKPNENMRHTTINNKTPM